MGCFEELSGYRNPGQGSVGDNEMTVVNGTAISAGMSRMLTGKYSKHKDVRPDSSGQFTLL